MSRPIPVPSEIVPEAEPEKVHETETAKETPTATDDRANAVFALEVVLIYLVTVVFQTLAVHYALASADGYEHRLLVQEDILRVLGSMWVDITALYFMIHGYNLCEFFESLGCESEHELVIDDLQLRLLSESCRVWMPDMLASTLLHCVFMVFAPSSLVQGDYVWTLVSMATTPFLLSTFFDFRVNRYFRSANESMWIAQLTLIYSLCAGHIHHYSRLTCLSMDSDSVWSWFVFKNVAAWAFGFLHLYAAFTHPVVGSAVTRSIFTNLIFFGTGVFIGLIPRCQVFQQRIRLSLTFFGDHGRDIAVGTTLVLTAFYMHHVQNTEESAQCVTVFGGAPCLWYVDICNVRLYPIFAFLLLWFTDNGLLFDSDMFGNIDTPLTKTFKHVSKWLSEWRDYIPVFLLYSEITAIAVDSLFMLICPTAAVNYSTIFILFEILLVTYVCVTIKHRLTPLLLAVFEGVKEYTGAEPLIRRMLSVFIVKKAMQGPGQ
jgi:hypothetical protein